jgi:uncharacterized membrane protein HdeD (DUF308 family)
MVIFGHGTATDAVADQSSDNNAQGAAVTLVETVKKSASTAKWVGIFMIIGGLLAVAAPLAAGLSVTVAAGFLLVVTSVAQTLTAFRGGTVGETFVLLMLGVLGVLTGAYMLSQPGAALGVLTLFLAGFFVAQGVVEIMAALRARPTAGWGWFLLGGGVSLLLGVMVWRQFPLSGAWAIGTLVGVRLLMSGVSLVAVASTVKAVSTGARAESGA